MLLVKRATKPLGIGSIVNINQEALTSYYLKKSGAFNDRLKDQKYIVIGKMNSCNQKIVRLLPIESNDNQNYNISHFRYSKKRRLIFAALSNIEDSKKTYLSIFGEEVRREVQNYLLTTHGINVTKA
jgi:hypothetical protein